MIPVIALIAVMGKAVVLPISGTVAPEIRSNAQAYLLDELRQKFAEVVVDSSRAEDFSACKEKACKVSVARELQADRLIALNLYKLGEQFQVKVEIVDPHRDSLLTYRVPAKDANDLFTVLERIAESAETMKPYETTARVGTVTQAESQSRDIVRKKLFISGGMSISRALGLKGFEKIDLADNSEKFHQWTKFEFLATMESKGFDLWANFSLFYFGTELAFLGHYYPSTANTSPFVGGGIGYIWVPTTALHTTESGNSYELRTGGSGLAFYLSGGMVFLRTYEAHLYLHARVFAILNSKFDTGASVGISFTHPFLGRIVWGVLGS